jgi:tetratricopeptide (TPR) repeat protein
MVQGKEYDKALEKFDEAQNVISQGGAPLKTEPFIYRAMTFAEKTRNMGSKDDLQTLEEVFIALKELDKAYDINDSNSNMLFLRSLIYMHLGKTDDGLQDIVKAISKS